MFGCIVAGRLVQTNLKQVDVNKYVFELPEAHQINHIVVFLLGTIPFEPGYAATVHLLWPNKSWQLLGMVSNEKPSAIFRLKSTLSPGETATMTNTSAELGISIEPVQTVEESIQRSHQSNDINNSGNLMSQALVAPQYSQKQQPPSLQAAKQFAERTLQNLFDYAMSFATRSNSSMAMFGSPSAGGGNVQVLPVKVFDDWYNSFLKKLQRDPEAASAAMSQ